MAEWFEAPTPNEIGLAFTFCPDLTTAPSYVDSGDTVHVITTLEA